jgi:hypothetical protein
MARTPLAASSQTRKRRSRPAPRWLETKTDLDQMAKNRLLLVLSVLSGEKPVTTAIEEHGISRGFYYQLETKAINAMLLALAPGSESDASPDATGLYQRIKQLEEKLGRAEAAQRRAERLLLMQRKMAGPAPVKTHRGRPTKTTTSSTPAGRRSWRSSTMTKRPAKQKRASSPKATTSTSTATPTGASEAPSGGSENSRGPTHQATT